MALSGEMFNFGLTTLWNSAENVYELMDGRKYMLWSPCYIEHILPLLMAYLIIPRKHSLGVKKM